MKQIDPDHVPRRPHGPPVPDTHFALPRLAEVYDVLDGDRTDLNLYGDIVDEFGATKVLDVGCGQGPCLHACPTRKRGCRCRSGRSLYECGPPKDRC